MLTAATAKPSHALPRVRARGQAWPARAGCKSAPRKISSLSRSCAHDGRALAQATPRQNALFLIASVSGSTIFAYVEGNPLRYVDPLGLGPWDKLYGYGKDFWRWFHKDDPQLFKELKDPKTGQIPKDVAQPYYDAWKKEKEGGFASPSLLEGLLPWGLTPSSLAPGTLWGPGTPYPTREAYDRSQSICR
jgi:hypothetical protein